MVPSELPPSRRFLGDIMTQRSSVSAACFLTSILLSTSAIADQVVLTAGLPPSGEQASGHNPPCGADGSATTADAVVSALAGGADYVIGLPIVSTITSNEDARNWVKVRLGIHNGLASCQTLCGALPSGASFSATGRIWDGEWSTTPTPLPITASDKPFDPDRWALIASPTIADAQDARVVCYQVKNWSHDRARDYEIVLDY